MVLALSRMKTQEGPQLSIIIPTMNEPLIQSLVEQVHDALSFVEHEIIVIDKSDSPPHITSARVLRQRSIGLGRAILEGLEVSSGDWVCVMDGDFSHRPEDLASMVNSVADRDFVLGSRYAAGGRNMDEPLRRVVSRIFNLLARLILRLNFSDPMSGFIVVRSEVFRNVKPNPIGFKINLELIYRATRLGFRGTEVPIPFRPRSLGKSKAGVKEAIRTASYILALKFRS